MSTKPEPTPLSREVAGRIGELIRDGRLGHGDRLVERRLAEDLGVSRSPVRGALQLLRDEGIAGPGAVGLVVIRTPESMPADPDDPVELYERLARDRLSGELAERVTEAALLRRYGCGRAALRDALRRVASEGWIERLPGYGWRFLPTLTTLRGYEESYRFRLAIEPAALLEPGFLADRPALEARRGEQQALLDGGVHTVSDRELFDLNSRLHETIIGCSHNEFFIDGLTRVDRLRRLIEYRQRLDPERALVRCREHISLVDAILAGRLVDASELMREHLSSVIPEKLTERRS
ncbi:GntR family transcriptional regulator [Nocardioides sp. LHG3406-4]|uniref:GntR family transcriptional regulator n=1 Tax=Nocardioides sp. LHG3406-4 TaxID=2804575 RepID=UPI003CF2FB1B